MKDILKNPYPISSLIASDSYTIDHYTSVNKVSAGSVTSGAVSASFKSDRPTLRGKPRPESLIGKQIANENKRQRIQNNMKTPTQEKPLPQNTMLNPVERMVLKFDMEGSGLSGLHYPVGINMPAAREWAKRAAHVFNGINDFRDRKVNLICRGSSGAILASLFSCFILHESTIVHVKKIGEDSHSSNYSVPGHVKKTDRVNVIIDDFICSGDTFDAIFEAIQVPRVHCIVCSNIDQYERYQCSYAICQNRF